MSGYIGAIPTPQATQSRDVYTATSNQTTFTTQGYTPDLVSVFLNGVHLARADYTATNGSDVVLAVGAAANDTVEIIAFGSFEASSSTFTGDVVASGGTLQATGDTAAGDDAAIGFTSAEGLILTGQGTTSDVTIKNDADATVMSIATGTTGATFAGDVIVPDGDLILGSTAVTSTAAELNILDGVTATAAELNIMDGVTSTAAEINLIDGGTARGTTAVADGDGFLTNDGGTMRMTSVDTLATYMGTKIGGGMEFIASSGAISDGTASVAFTGFDASKYDHYAFFLQYVVPVTDAVLLLAQSSTDNGSNYATTSGNYHGAGTTDTAGFTVAGFSGYTIGSGSNEFGVSGNFMLYAPHNSSTYTMGNCSNITYNSADADGYITAMAWGGPSSLQTTGSARIAAEDVDALRFIFTSGNIESGEITMFGIVNS